MTERTRGLIAIAGAIVLGSVLGALHTNFWLVAFICGVYTFFALFFIAVPEVYTRKFWQERTKNDPSQG